MHQDRCGRDTVGVSRRLAMQLIQVTLIAAAAGFFVALVTGPVRGAGAAANRTTTTAACGILCHATTTSPATTLPPTTSAGTTVPPSTSPVTTSAPRTVAPPPRQTFPSTSFVPTTTTLTTIPGINGHLPVSPSTLPFTTKQQSSHVSPVFAALSGAGFFVALVIVVVRFLLTRPGRR